MLTIRQAITLLRMDMDAPGSADIQDLVGAERLAIGALKEVIKARKGNPAFYGELLPGEAQEDEPPDEPSPP